MKPVTFHCAASQAPVFLFFFFNDPPPTEFYPLPLHAALPISGCKRACGYAAAGPCPASGTPPERRGAGPARGPPAGIGPSAPPLRSECYFAELGCSSILRSIKIGRAHV